MTKEENKKLAPLSFMEERLNSLTQLKQTDELQTQSEIRRKKANMKEANAPNGWDYRTQISSTVKMQKDAEFQASIPEWTFIPLDGDARQNRKIAKKSWDFHWLASNTDKHMSDIIQSSTTNGTWVLEEWIEHVFRTVKRPKYVELKDESGKVMKDENGLAMLDIEYEEVVEFVKSGIYSRRIPFPNFFINGTSMDNATECIAVAYYDLDEYLNEKENDPAYSKLEEVRASSASFYIVDGTVGNDFDTTTPENTVIELRYFNSATDTFMVTANWIEVRDTPIPYTHKRLPFALYYDNKADNRIYGIGEYELLEQEERVLNELRTLLIKWVKFSIGFLMSDRNADVEIETAIAWLGETLETDDMNAIKQVTFTVPIADISSIENKIQNDIIAKSWVDFKSLYLSAWETATKTDNKALSSKKRINKNIKDNAYDFYRVFAELRMANIQFLHSAWTQEIPIEGGSISADGVFHKEEGGGFGSGIIGAEYTKGKFLVLPIVETMLGNSKQRRRAETLQLAQVVGNIMGEDGKPVVPWSKVVEMVVEDFDRDFEKLTEATPASKSPKDVLSDFKKQTQWTAWTASDDGFVPPEQRNQSAAVPTISGAASLPDDNE